MEMTNANNIDFNSWMPGKETSDSKDKEEKQNVTRLRRKKILSSTVLGERIADTFKKEKGKVEGIATLYSWIFNSNGKMRRAPLDCIIETMRKLREEGYE